MESKQLFQARLLVISQNTSNVDK